MKQLLVILTLLMFLKPILPVLEYVVNYDYIVNELCENKLKPELKCNGKCHLMKELGKNAETDSSQPLEKKTTTSEKEVLFYEESCRYCNRSLIVEEEPKLNYEYQNLYAFLNPNSLFRPPAMLS